jgi:hypothetical protein
VSQENKPAGGRWRHPGPWSNGGGCVRRVGILPMRLSGIGILVMRHGQDAHATRNRPLTYPLRLWAASICVLAAGLSCPARMDGPAVVSPRSDEAAANMMRGTGGSDDLVLFFTGSELGSLRPCGCSGGQLGGIEKRSAVFDAVPASRRLVVETGSLVSGDHEQDLIKFRIFFEALRRLKYDAVHLTGPDFETATRLGLQADAQPFPVLYAAREGQSPVFTKRVTAGGRDITVNLVSFDSPSAVLHPPSFAGEPQDALTVNILILNYDPKPLLEGVPRELLLRSWMSPGAECVVCPSDTDEPQLLSKPGGGPLVFTVGRFGRHIVRLGVTIGPEDRSYPADDGPQTGAPGPKTAHFKLQTSSLKLRFDSIPVQAKLPDDPALVQLYRQYQQLVAQSGLLESYPRVPLPDKAAFVGSRSCRPCHESAYDKWSATGHAHALEALKKVGSERDPECVVCHVVGLAYEGGFVNEEKTPHLAGVGCETCHGPGSVHVLGAGQPAPGQPKTACAKCHTPERSAGFAGHEEEFMKKISHKREPAAAGKVKY